MTSPGPDSHDTGARALRRYFDRAASRYRADIEPAFAPLVEGLIAFAHVGDPARIIDLGAGTGLVTRQLMRQHAHVCAVDFSRPMLVEARRAGVPGVVQGDAHRLPFRHGTFDLALASFAFNSTDPFVSFGEVFRVVKPRGRLVFQEWGTPDDLSEIVSDTVAGYAVDDPPDWLHMLREVTELPVRWDELESVEDIGEAVASAGFELERVSVVDTEVQIAGPDDFLSYKLAWPSRRAEVDAMPDDIRRLLFSDLRENLAPHVVADGSLVWRPQVIRISAYKPASA